ncbi:MULTISPECIES: DUF5686 and carboxypeptidase-like regulatory domain-containing protein [unclassified Aureispira]|uniref:DUF5686 and carboxypeptidase-like regulatory domain-containing protein n=1 Tax=unclassified Aureispira TaxID=2649989 RepID=UPI0006966A4C|nr:MULTISPECIES: DUF5686 and carboxypeptidase-like regulatory domain-containing protein [unclassified Aureispira]WMX14053.1 DUF5686 family protein [Aureispira sp. CCB-E]
MKNTILTLSLFLFFSTLNFAQTITITGSVIDDDTEEAMPFCNVYVYGTSTGVTTDIDGNYIIQFDISEGDTLATNSLGYIDVLKPIDSTKSEQVINFRMKSSSIDMGLDITVVAGENPANEIIRQINKHKPQNDLEGVVASYETEQYTKVELDLVNITKDMKDMKIFKKLQFIFDNIDTVSDVKPFLPAYVAESISDVYYVQGKEKKEMLKAQRVSGVKNQTVVEFIGSMNQEYNIYDNTIKILGKEFISPFSNVGLTFYEYYIMDSTQVKGQWSYKLKFKPKDKSGNTFYGDFWVSMEDYALLLVNMRMNPGANVNLVNRIIIYQEYDRYKEKYWIPLKQKTVIDFAMTKKDKGLGIIGRKTVSFKDFKIDQNETEQTFQEKDPEDIRYDELAKADTFWTQNRHEELSKNEKGVYKMVDSVQNIPLFKTIAEIATIVVNGYKDIGPIKIGPYSKLFTWNDVEGVRLSLGVGTSNKLSKKFQIYGYVGYGFKDKRWKYGGNTQYVFNRYRRSAIGASFFNDATFENRSSEERKTQSLFAGWLRRAIPQKMMYVQEGKVWFHHTWKKGFSNRLAVMHRRLNPVGHENTRFGGLNFKFLQENAENGSVDTITQIRSTEMVFKTRFAYKERKISGPFKDLSLGSKFPIVSLDYTLGVKGILQSQFNFHKVRLGIKHWFFTSPVGWVEYELEVGKIFSATALPYLLLEVHPGNEAYFYNKTSFNSMNSFEFVSDFFVHARIEHHWDGFILNRIKFIRDYLKWRLVTAARASWGTLSAKHEKANHLNHYDRSIKRSKDRQRPFTEGPFYGTFDKGPYTEVSIGIENILQFIRVDALWRINYLDNRDAQRFSVRVTLNFTF